MSDDLTPTPWGVLVDVATNETVGPATEDQWRYQQDNPGAYLTLPDGVQADVVGGPETLDCGHTEAEHESRWDECKRYVVTLVTWVRANVKPDSAGYLPVNLAEDLNSWDKAVALAAVTAGLMGKAGFSAEAIETVARKEQAPIVGMVLRHVLSVATGDVSLHPKFSYLVEAVDWEERAFMVGLAASVLDRLDMSDEDFSEMVTGMKWMGSHGPI